MLLLSKTFQFQEKPFWQQWANKDLSPELLSVSPGNWRQSCNLHRMFVDVYIMMGAVTISPTTRKPDTKMLLQKFVFCRDGALTHQFHPHHCRRCWYRSLWKGDFSLKTNSWSSSSFSSLLAPSDLVHASQGSGSSMWQHRKKSTDSETVPVRYQYPRIP